MDSRLVDTGLIILNGVFASSLDYGQLALSLVHCVTCIPPPNIHHLFLKVLTQLTEQTPD